MSGPAGGESMAALLAAGGVRFAVDGAVATVTLATPERRNAQTPDTWRALTAIGSALPGSVRAVLLRAEGPSFSAGLDLRLLDRSGPGTLASLFGEATSERDIEAAIAEHQRAFTWWRRNDLLSVAVVQGHAVGAGLQLALACDLRVLADDALLCVREPALGLVPDLAGAQALVDAVGYARALEICLTGRWVRAEEALRLGLATRVAPRGELDAAAQDLVDALLAPPRDAAVETKALLRDAARRGYDEQRAAERAAQARRLRDLAGLGE